MHVPATIWRVAALVLWASAAVSASANEAPPSTRALPATRPVPPPTEIHYRAADRPDVLLIHLPGVSGYMPVDRTLLKGLVDGLQRQQLTPRVTVLEWSNYDRGLGALMNEPANRIQATRVARAIVEARQAAGDRPVYITAHSGGAGVLLWALEQLPDGVAVDRIVLLAPAVSPDYDLSAALSRVRGECFVLSSPFDTVLKMTRAFGTLDRKYVTSAGVDGFVVPQRFQDDPGPYSRLVHMPYRDDYARYDNTGDHVGALATEFARRVLAPALTGKQARDHPSTPSVP